MNKIIRQNDLNILLDYLARNKAKGITDIIKLLNWSPKHKKDNRKILEEWENEGFIMKTKSDRYTLPEKIGFAVGNLDVIKDRFAFVDTPTDGIFVPKSAFKDALAGDRVLIKITKDGQDGKKREGEVFKVLKREKNKVIGIFERSQSFGFVKPTHSFGKDIFIPKKFFSGARNGELVVVEITFWGGENKKPEGKIVEILGDPYNTDIMIKALIEREGLSEDFPRGVKSELKEIKKIDEKEIKNRVDLRDLPIITIDGDDAKDLDDAVYVEKLKNGNHRLIVAIADVSYYIPEGSSLDEEAKRRGNSVYLVDRVIPMFPKEISNGVCSLNPNEDKFTFACDMEIDDKGKVVKYDTYKAVINTKYRMTYNNVNKILKKDSEMLELYHDIVDMVFEMHKLSGYIRNMKKSRGSIDFDLPEIKVVLDDRKKVKYLKNRERGESERIIEDFMIAANETVAEKVFWMELPFVYRTHERPEIDRIKMLNESLSKFGIRINGYDELHPGKFQKIIEETKDTDLAMLVHKLVLMAMKQARYTMDNVGHFGLSSTYYTHFTSPIRRYADLMVHRILGETLKGYPRARKLAKWEKELDTTCTHISKTERTAMKIEDESIRIKVVEYMMDRIGEVYPARITGMNRNGLFIETSEYVECFFNVIASKDYYEWDEVNFEMVNTDTHEVFKLGQKLDVMVVRADLNELSVEVVPYTKEMENIYK